MLLPALTLMSALSGLVLWGSSTCPGPRDVDARLAGRIPNASAVSLHVELRAGDAHELVLRDAEGRVVATRRLSSGATCDALAEEAASVIVSWVLAPPRPRRPLQVGYIEPPPPPPELRRFELWVSGGVSAGFESRRLSVSGMAATAEVHHAPQKSGALLSAALAVEGPVRIAGGNGATGQGWRVALGLGAGARARLGFVALDAFVLFPVSLVTPTAVDLAPLSGGLQSGMLLGVQAGVRVSGWEGRFAPFLRLAIDATLVSSGQLMTLPVALSLGAGIAWSGA